MKLRIKKFLKRVFIFIGYDVLRYYKNPLNTLLGLKKIPFKTIIDVGSNKAQFAEVSYIILHDAKISCFETLPEPYQQLSQLAQRKNGSMIVNNIALGNEDFFFKQKTAYEITR